MKKCSTSAASNSLYVQDLIQLETVKQRDALLKRHFLYLCPLGDQQQKKMEDVNVNTDYEPFF